MRVAVTRPEPNNERSAKTLCAQGHDVLLAPLMRVEPVAADLAGAWSAVVVTSANAPRALAADASRALLTLPLFAVGARSAEAARAAGFTQVTSADGDVHALVRLVAERHKGNAPVLYLAGEHRAADFVSALARRGVATTMRVVYRAVTAPFPPALIEALRGKVLDAVFHYSKRSAENFVAGARVAGVEAEALATNHICLSEQVAAPLRQAGAARIAVAKHPDEASLIELLEVSGR